MNCGLILTHAHKGEWMIFKLKSAPTCARAKVPNGKIQIMGAREN